MSARAAQLCRQSPLPRASTESGGSAARAGAGKLRLIQGGLEGSAEQAGGWGLTRPILFAGGQGNLYVYVGNDPVGFVDPEGKQLTNPTTAAFFLAGSMLANGLAGYLGGDQQTWQDFVLGAEAGGLVAWGAIAVALGSPLGGVLYTGLGIGLSLAGDTQLFTEPIGAVGTAASEVGSMICEAFAGSVGPFACPFAGEAAKAATDAFVPSRPAPSMCSP